MIEGAADRHERRQLSGDLPAYGGRVVWRGDNDLYSLAYSVELACILSRLAKTDGPERRFWQETSSGIYASILETGDALEA